MGSWACRTRTSRGRWQISDPRCRGQALVRSDRRDTAASGPDGADTAGGGRCEACGAWTGFETTRRAPGSRRGRRAGGQASRRPDTRDGERAGRPRGGRTPETTSRRAGLAAAGHQRRRAGWQASRRPDTRDDEQAGQRGHRRGRPLRGLRGLDGLRDDAPSPRLAARTASGRAGLAAAGHQRRRAGGQASRRPDTRDDERAGRPRGGRTPETTSRPDSADTAGGGRCEACGAWTGFETTRRAPGSRRGRRAGGQASRRPDTRDDEQAGHQRRRAGRTARTPEEEWRAAGVALERYSPRKALIAGISRTAWTSPAR